MLTLICSNKVRPAVQTGSHHGNQWWKRDVFHVARETINETLCGIDAAGWLSIEKRERQKTVGDPNLCSRCAKRLEIP